MVELLQLACCAPSPGNRQMWRFIVITNEDLKNRLADIISDTILRIVREAGKPDAWVEGARHGATFFRQAPVLIAVTTTRYFSRVDEALLKVGKEQLYIDTLRCRPDLQAVGAAVQTLLLAAHERGLGGCYLTGPMAARPYLEEMLEITPPRQLAAMVALGYPAVELGRKPLREVTEVATFVR